jgi:hypothetical protein
VLIVVVIGGAALQRLDQVAGCTQGSSRHSNESFTKCRDGIVPPPKTKANRRAEPTIGRRRVIDRLIGGRRHYAWLIVLVTFVTLITTAGFRATPGVLIVPLQEEFGWSRGTISIAISLGLVLFGLTAPFSAALMERFGVQRDAVRTRRGREWRRPDDADEPRRAARPAVGRRRRRRNRRGFHPARRHDRDPLVLEPTRPVTGILTASNASADDLCRCSRCWRRTTAGGGGALSVSARSRCCSSS